MYKRQCHNSKEKSGYHNQYGPACDRSRPGLYGRARRASVSYTHLVVCYLIDKETGQIISTRSGANPQRSFGADVLSRIDAAARADDNDKANGGLQMMQIQICLLYTSRCV